MFRSSVAYSVANSLAEPEKKQNSFELDIAAIKKYLVDIANTYLLIAYRLYEVDVNKSYKGNGYKNIFEACEKELGFKKSTVYNLLRIVKIYGRDDETGDITYQALSRSGDYSYAQLVEMLSMTSIQRSLVTPDTTVKEMRKIKQAEKTKKFQTSGKIETAAEPVKTPILFRSAVNGDIVISVDKKTGSTTSLIAGRTYEEKSNNILYFSKRLVKEIEDFTSRLDGMDKSELIRCRDLINGCYASFSAVFDELILCADSSEASAVEKHAVS